MNETARATISRILETARSEKRSALLETEGMIILESLGIDTPRSHFVNAGDSVTNEALSGFPGEKVVLKVVSKDILHKTELGGVKILPKNAREITAAIAEMHQRLADRFELKGYTINEMVPFSPGFGSELLVSLRTTEDFGPILTVGAGGTNAEFLGSALKSGEAMAILDPGATDPNGGSGLTERLRSVAAVRYAALPQRGQPALMKLETLETVLEKLCSLAREFGEELEDFEINPLVVSQTSQAQAGPGSNKSRLVALDALVKLRQPRIERDASPRPLKKLRSLLEPRSIAIMGVSEKMNPGRVILKNTLAQGFPPENVIVVKPGSSSIDGCRCVPDLGALPDKVDLLVLSVSAAQAGDAVIQAIQEEKTESIVLIPGGLEEKSGNEALVQGMREALSASRSSTWGGPVINGGNCLGIRSVPGRTNTLFIPESKLPLREGQSDPLAIISQSGAFSICRLSKLGAINPRYTLSIGNQMDLTVSDYLAYLKDDPALQVIAVYIEGFKPGDGRRFLDVSREIVRSGRPVILYCAGRTAAGAAASASHTASIAGNWEVTRQLCADAGIIVADTIEEFEDLTRVSLALSDSRLPRRPGKRPGAGLGAISNAGFECVAFADNLGHFWVPEFSKETLSHLSRILDEARISGIVDVHNPLDLTPMANDSVFSACVRAVLDDASVDCAIVGAVPLTPAFQDDVESPGSLVQRLGALRKASEKPFVAVVDSGVQYDPMAQELEACGIPAFRSADRALRVLDRYARWRQLYAP